MEHVPSIMTEQDKVTKNNRIKDYLENKNLPYVTVDEELMKHAHLMGTKRYNENIGRPDSLAYQGSLQRGRVARGEMYQDLTSWRLSCVGEIASASYMGIDPWSLELFVPRDEHGNYPTSLYQNADIIVDGQRVEVRNTNEPWKDMPFRAKDVKSNVILLQVHVEFDWTLHKPTGRVFLLRWADAVEDYDKCERRYDAGKNRYWSEGRPMSTFPLMGRVNA